MDNIPILRKRPESPPGVRMEFRLVPDPTFDEEERMVAPPHWEVRQEGVDDPIAWGPMESAGSFHRLFALASIAAREIPEPILDGLLSAMGVGPPRSILDTEEGMPA